MIQEPERGSQLKEINLFRNSLCLGAKRRAHFKELVDLLKQSLSEVWNLIHSKCFRS